MATLLLNRKNFICKADFIARVHGNFLIRLRDPAVYVAFIQRPSIHQITAAIPRHNVRMAPADRRIPLYTIIDKPCFFSDFQYRTHNGDPSTCFLMEQIHRRVFFSSL